VFANGTGQNLRSGNEPEAFEKQMRWKPVVWNRNVNRPFAMACQHPFHKHTSPALALTRRMHRHVFDCDAATALGMAEKDESTDIRFTR
jgi:hypothetical protein